MSIYHVVQQNSRNLNHLDFSSLLASQVAVGTGFTQLFRGIGMSTRITCYSNLGKLTPLKGQLSGVGGASAVFQSLLNRELRNRITGPDAEEVYTCFPFRVLRELFFLNGDELQTTDCSANSTFSQIGSHSSARPPTYSSRVLRHQSSCRILFRSCIYVYGVLDSSSRMLRSAIPPFSPCL